MSKNILEQVQEIAKSYGNAMLGAGLMAMAATVYFVGNGALERFDKVEGIVQDVKEGADTIRLTQENLTRDLTALRTAMPQLGTEFGNATGNAASALEQRLQCTEENQQDCEGGVRGKILDGIGKLRNGQ